MAVACSTSIRSGASLEEALTAIASIGIPKVDLLTIDGWVHVHPSDLVRDFEGMVTQVDVLLKQYGVTPIALNTAVGPQLHDRSDEANERRSRETEALIRLMQHYNITLAAIQPRNPDPLRPYPDVLQDCIATLRQQTAAGAESGITFALELHINSPFETLAQAQMLLEELPELALVYDPSHFVMQGIDLSETTWLLQHAAHVHLRDADRDKMQVAFGTGAIDFDWLLGVLKDSGYAGDFSIEYLQTNDFDVLVSVRQLYERLLEY
jgi:sugar phosphate isomerase/epimerase